MQPFRIAILGLWHLGEIYSAGLAELGHEVVGISEDEGLIANFKKGEPPLPEPGLKELIVKNQLEGRLRYSVDFSEIAKANVLWLAFDTPVNDEDDVDLSPIWNALEKSLPHLSTSVLLVVSSQIPVGTSKKISEVISRERPGLKFKYVYTPENLRLGEAVKCFLEPDRIVIGAESAEAFLEMEKIFSKVKADIVKMSPSSAEVAKHALNAFLATSVSFINDIADVCEKSGADILEVSRALRSDSRIGHKAFLDAGLGFSGGTLGRDLKVLMNFSKENGLSVPVVEGVFLKNKKRKSLVVERLEKEFGNLRGKVISILGLTYKPGTRTLRRSRALEIAADLSWRGASLRLHDPAVQKEELPAIKNSIFYSDLYETAVGSEVLIFITPWPEFKSLDFQRLAAAADNGAVFFDTCNLFYNQESRIIEAGFRYCGVGRNILYET